MVTFGLVMSASALDRATAVGAHQRGVDRSVERPGAHCQPQLRRHALQAVGQGLDTGVLRGAVHARAARASRAARPPRCRRSRSARRCWSRCRRWRSRTALETRSSPAALVERLLHHGVRRRSPGAPWRPRAGSGGGRYAHHVSGCESGSCQTCCWSTCRASARAHAADVHAAGRSRPSRSRASASASYAKALTATAREHADETATKTNERFFMLEGPARCLPGKPANCGLRGGLMATQARFCNLACGDRGRPRVRVASPWPVCESTASIAATTASLARVSRS